MEVSVDLLLAIIGKQTVEIEQQRQQLEVAQKQNKALASRLDELQPKMVESNGHREKEHAR